MRKTVIIVLISFLFCANVFADEIAQLPELPAVESDNSLNNNEISFWQKLKNFFGLGDDVNKEKNKDITNATTHVDSLNIGEEKPLPHDIIDLKLPDEVKVVEKSNLNTDQQKNIVASVTSNDVNPNSENDDFSKNEIDIPSLENIDKPIAIDQKIEMNGTKEDKSTIKNNEPLNDLKLPEDFEDKDIKKINDNNSKAPDAKNNIETKNSEQIEVPQLQVPTFDKIDNKNVNNIETKNSKQIEVPQLQVPTFDNTVNNKDSKNNDANLTKEIKSKPEISAQTKIVPVPDMVPDVSANSKIVSNNNSKTDNNIINNNEPEKSSGQILPITNNSNIVTKSNENTAIESLVPIYANTTFSKTDDLKVLKYKAEFKNNKDELKTIPKISEKKLAKVKTTVSDDILKDDAKQIEFIKNEAQVLTLPNDEIVLGNITNDAKYEQMEFRSYVDLFWHEYNELVREPKRKELAKFIKNYNENFNENY